MNSEDLCIQPAGFLLQLSSDWIVLGASENVEQFLGQSHRTLVDKPLSEIIREQPLHDLRNLFQRLGSTTAIARAYHMRLTDSDTRLDLAFQRSGSHVLLEAIPSPSTGIGECIGSVGGLIAGLASASGRALLDGGARRMRALTGFDQVRLSIGEESLVSGRTPPGGEQLAAVARDLPRMIADCAAAGVPVHPRKPGDTSLGSALLASPAKAQAAALEAAGIRSLLRVPISFASGEEGMFECLNRGPRALSIELHAAAELFAQMFALRLEAARASQDG